MNQFTIGQGGSEAAFTKLGQFLVIGVQASDEGHMYDLDRFLKARPYLKVVKRLPETHNPKYPNEEGEHLLQPAILEYNVYWKKEQEAKTPKAAAVEPAKAATITTAVKEKRPYVKRNTAYWGPANIGTAYTI